MTNFFWTHYLWKYVGKQYHIHHKKKQKNLIEKNLITEIQTLEENGIDLNLLEEKKGELYEIRREKMRGHFVRSKAKWIEEGEKPTNYFCNLESRHFHNKLITSLKLDNGEIVDDQKHILQETNFFYAHLYSKQDNTEDDFIHKLQLINFEKLTDEEANKLEGKITYAEALNFLKNMKNEKSPGSDGYTTEFFKFFWVDLGHFVVRSINYSFDNMEMSNSQKLGVITCIPKSGKVKNILKNWRPISLLNCSYKIAT